MKTRAQQILHFLAGGLFTYAAFISPLSANPQDGTVVAGNATIQQADPKTLVIQQQSDKAIIDWQRFNIAADEHTRFQQPGSGSIILNRVVGGDPSKIFGQLSANGKVVLVNPAGIYMAPTARINVNSLIATTANITNENFMAGNYKFVQAPDQATSVINEGEIRAAEGLVALVAPAVRNSGLIEANLGKVVLASGNEYTVDLYGDQIINFAVNNKVNKKAVDNNNQTMDDAVSNKGTIIADGGKIIMTANVAQNVVQNVINMEGVAQARSVVQKNGEIILSGGETGIVKVSGKIDASGKNSGRKGGVVKVLGQNIKVENATIDASGDQGGGTILVGGNYQGKGVEQNAKTTLVDANSQLDASAINNGDGGKIIIWSDDYTQFGGQLVAKGGALDGNGGFAEVSGKALLAYQGHADLTAAHGTIGTLLLDPYDIEIRNASSNPASPTFPYTSTQDTSVINTTTLANALASASVLIQTGAGGSQTGNITVVDNLTWTGSTTLTLVAHNNIVVNSGATITNSSGGSLVLRANDGGTYSAGTGNGTVTMSGNLAFSGGGNIKIYYNNPSSSSFSASAPTSFTTNISGTKTVYMYINNVTDLQNMSTNLAGNYALSTDIDASATSGWNSGAGFVPVGNASTLYTGKFDGLGREIDGLFINRPTTDNIGLFGAITGATIENVGLTNANITGQTSVGALVGRLSNGTISKTYSELGIISGSGSGIGGLIGTTTGGTNLTLSQSHTTGTVTSTGTGQQFIGGLIGLSNSFGGGTGTISNNYSLATVNGGTSGSVGGLIGFNNNKSNVSKNYSGGAVSGANNVGGLIGTNNGAPVSNNYWDEQTSGVSVSAGGSGAVGKTTVQMMQQSTFSGWDFSGVWGIIEGGSYPYLLTNHPTTPQVVSGKAFTDVNAGTTVGSGVQVGLAQDGTQFATTYTNNGFYYFLLPTGSIAPQAPIITYLNTGSTLGNSVAIYADSGTNYISNNHIYGNAVTARNYSLTGSMQGSDLAAPITNNDGPPSFSSKLLYSVSGNDITINNNGVMFQTVNNTDTVPTNNNGPTFNLVGNINTNGNINFNGAVQLGANVNVTTGNGNINFNNTLMGPYDLTLSANSGDITFVGAAGSSANRLGTLTIQNARNVTEYSALEVSSFVQQNGSGTTAFGGSGLNAANNVFVYTNYISGSVTAGGSAVLIGLNGMNLQANVGALTLGGLNGGTVTGTVAGLSGAQAALQTRLATNSQGVFTMNNITVGTFNPNIDIFNIAQFYDPYDNGDDTTEYPDDLGYRTLQDVSANTVIQIDGDSAMLLAARAICQ